MRNSYYWCSACDRVVQGYLKWSSACCFCILASHLLSAPITPLWLFITNWAAKQTHKGRLSLLRCWGVTCWFSLMLMSWLVPIAQIPNHWIESDLNRYLSSTHIHWFCVFLPVHEKVFLCGFWVTSSLKPWYLFFSQGRKPGLRAAFCCSPPPSFQGR